MVQTMGQPTAWLALGSFKKLTHFGPPCPQGAPLVILCWGTAPIVMIVCQTVPLRAGDFPAWKAWLFVNSLLVSSGLSLEFCSSPKPLPLSDTAFLLTPFSRSMSAFLVFLQVAGRLSDHLMISAKLPSFGRCSRVT